MQRAWVIAALLAAACAAPGIITKGKAKYLYSILDDKEPELALLDDEEKNGDTSIKFDIPDQTFNEITGYTALPPLEDEIYSTAYIESINSIKNKIKQGIDDNKTNAVTNPSTIGKNSNDNGSESNDFAETPDHTFNEIRGNTALPPLENEIYSTAHIESINSIKNKMKQGIDDNNTNAVTNPSIIGKNSNKNGSESNDFAETTPKSKIQRGYVTYETENTVTSQYKSDYDNSDPDTPTTKYDETPNNIPTLKTIIFNENNQSEVGEDEYWENVQNEDSEDEARRTSKKIETNNSEIDSENEGDEDESTSSFIERRTLKGRKTNNSAKVNQDEGDEDEDIWEYRRRQRYPNPYDKIYKYRGSRKRYAYKDSDDCYYYSPYRNMYDDYYRLSDDKTRSHWHYGFRDRKRCRDNNRHEGIHYFTKERNSGRKYYRNDEYNRDDRHFRNNWYEGRRYYNKERNSGRKYYRNDQYNRDDRHYGKFARRNGWRDSKSYSRHHF